MPENRVHQANSEKQPPQRPSDDKHPPAKAPNTDGGGKIRKPNYKFFRRTNSWIAIFTGLIFFVNGVYVYFALEQWGEMRRSNDLTENSNEILKKSSETSMRAWLGTVRDGFWIKLGPNDVIRTQIIIKNTGRTPAFNAAGNVTANISNTPLLLEPVCCPLPGANQIPRSQALIGPSEEYILGPTEIKMPSNIAKLYRAGNSGLKMYAKACVTYEDVFHKQHRLRFCAIAKEGTNSVILCDRWNDTDY